MRAATCACCRWCRAIRGRNSSTAAPTSRSASSPTVAHELAAEGPRAIVVLEPLYACEYVCVMRRDHALAREAVLSLDAYCAAEHVRVSFAGRPRGFVDEALAARGRERRVVLTVNQFATAARVVHESDLLSVLPRSFVPASGFAAGWRCAPCRSPCRGSRSACSGIAATNATLAQRWLRARSARSFAASRIGEPRGAPETRRHEAISDPA